MMLKIRDPCNARKFNLFNNINEMFKVKITHSNYQRCQFSFAIVGDINERLQFKPGFDLLLKVISFVETKRFSERRQP